MALFKLPPLTARPATSGPFTQTPPPADTPSVNPAPMPNAPPGSRIMTPTEQSFLTNDALKTVTQQSQDPSIDVLTRAGLTDELSDFQKQKTAADAAKAKTGGTTTGGPFDPNAFANAWMGSGGRTVQDFSNFVNSWNQQHGSTLKTGGTKGDKLFGPDGTFYGDFVLSAGMGGLGAQYLPPGAGGGGGGGETSAAGAGNVFSDPATSQWETLLRQLVDRMNQPQPTWTPAQMDLQKTQFFDPLEQQKTAQKQRVTEHFAGRGIGPGSGILEQALQDVDRQFTTLETQAQANIAQQAISREDQLFGSNEARAANAVNTFGQIPQLADSRLNAARQSLIPSDPSRLLGLYPDFAGLAQSQYANSAGQSNAFWNNLMQILLNIK
jgi:hypothetical protein